jgi:hypothetical protein
MGCRVTNQEYEQPSYRSNRWEFHFSDDVDAEDEE